MATLEREIEAYEGMREDLERDYFSKWIVVYGGEVVGTFDDSSESVQFAAENYGRGPYLIRQVGVPPAHLPASALMGGRRG